MPLRIKCHSCKRTLVLDALYQGGFCRCAFCHTHQRVTYTGRAAPRPAVRPDQPGLRIQSIGAVGRAPHWAAGASIDIQDAGESSSSQNLPRWHWSSTVVALLVMVTCAFVWRSSSIRDGRPIADAREFANSYEAQLAAARVDVDSLLEASGEDDFFGVSIDDGPFAIVIDDSNSMTQYAEPVARLAYAASVFAESNGLDFSAIAARSSDLKLSDQGEDGKAVEQVTPVGYARRIGGFAPFQSSAASLSEAVAMTDRATTERLFVFLARALPEVEQKALVASVRELGIQTHVIVLGDAMSVDYASVAVAGNGWTLPVSDPSLATLVDRCPVEVPIPSK